MIDKAFIALLNQALIEQIYKEDLMTAIRKKQEELYRTYPESGAAGAVRDLVKFIEEWEKPE